MTLQYRGFRPAPSATLAQKAKRFIATSIKPTRASITLPEMKGIGCPTYEVIAEIRKQIESVRAEKLVLEKAIMLKADQLKSARAIIHELQSRPKTPPATAGKQTE